jgi:hypothetical protein
MDNFRRALKWLLTAPFRLIFWLISLPFRFLGWLFSPVAAKLKQNSVYVFLTDVPEDRWWRSSLRLASRFITPTS